MSAARRCNNAVGFLKRPLKAATAPRTCLYSLHIAALHRRTMSLFRSKTVITQEAIMSQNTTQTTHPSKEAVRDLMQQRRAEQTPPPAPERIREQLGWWLIPANKLA